MSDRKVIRIQPTGYFWQDQRGWRINPLKIAGMEDKVLADLHWVSMVSGAVRGNHYHPDTTEWLIFSDGPARLLWRKDDKVPIHIEIVEAGPVIFEIPPGIRHAAVNDSSRTVYLLSFSSSGERKTLRCPSLLDISE